MGEVWMLENEDDSNHRPGHIQSLSKFRLWINSDCPGRTFSVYMCCRYGKSDTIRNLALLAIAANKASSALVIHPGPDLASQFLDIPRLKSWRSRWLPSGPRLSKVQVLPDFACESMCGGEWIGSIHIQAVMQPGQQMLLMQWIKKCVDDGKPAPIVFFDEAHQFSSGNKWGSVARKLHKAGCLVVVMTATPFRSDGDDVFGFRKRAVGETESKEIRYVQPCSTDPAKLELHTVSRDETTFLLEADVEVPFSQGWQEGHIAKVTFDPIDWNMEGYGEKHGDARLLSEIPKEEARSVLPLIYRDPEAIKQAVRRALGHVENFRKHDPDATCVWYGMNDGADDDEASANQKAISKAIKDIDPSMSVGIATMSSDAEGDEKSREVIRKFCDTRKKSHDFLVLKQMGGSGLDSDRIHVVVLWNTIRALNSLIQQAMRGGNSATKKHFVVIHLNDRMTIEELNAFVSGEGGQYIDSVETDHSVEIIDKQEGGVDSGYVPVDVADTGMSDSDGTVASYDDVCMVVHVLKLFPKLIGHYTFPQIAEKAKSLGFVTPNVPDESPFVDTTAVCETAGENLGSWVKKIGRRIFFTRHGRKGTDSSEDKSEHGEIYREVQAYIKKRSGVHGSWDKSSKKRSQSPQDYRKWTAAAESIWEEVSREANS